MTALKTYVVEIWVSDCYLVADIEAASPEAAEQYALGIWEQGELEPVPDIQEVTSTYIEEIKP
jgi:hypothetical protein